MTEISLHIGARMADYIHTHPYDELSRQVVRSQLGVLHPAAVREHLAHERRLGGLGQRGVGLLCVLFDRGAVHQDPRLERRRVDGQADGNLETMHD